MLISANLARELFGSAQSALGRRLSACSPTAKLREVIGVVQDVRDKNVRAEAPATVYFPPLTEGAYAPSDLGVARDVTLMVRTGNAGSDGMLKNITQAVWSVNNSIPLASMQTMQTIVDMSLAPMSLATLMLAIAGSMALFLGIVGIYGVISYSVSLRRREIGIRLALGARPETLKALFVRRALALTSVGAAFGLIA